jgi:hypothetical protein
MLPARAQIVLLLGPEFIAFYNDPYAPTIGGKHPKALGQPARENWAELWDDLEPLLRRVLETGETVCHLQIGLFRQRNGSIGYILVCKIIIGGAAMISRPAIRAICASRSTDKPGKRRVQLGIFTTAQQPSHTLMYCAIYTTLFPTTSRKLRRRLVRPLSHNKAHKQNELAESARRGANK